MSLAWYHAAASACSCLQVVLDLALQLYFMYLIKTPHMQLSPLTRPSHVTPYVWLSALLLVAIKLLYGLGNAAGGVSRPAVVSPHMC
jgi:hypothetical protein